MEKIAVAGSKDRMLYIWKVAPFPILFLTNFILGLSMSFFAPYSSLFGIDEVGMSNIEFGIFMTVVSIGGVFISTYIGKLSDVRESRKRLLIITLVAALLGYGGFAYFRNYYALLLIGFFLLGTASAAIPQLWAYAREALKQSPVPDSETPYVMNIFRMFFALSWTFGPALAAWILVLTGFSGLFLFVALGYGLVIPIIFFLLKDVPREKTVKKEQIVLRKFIFQPHIFANLFAMLLLTAATTINMLNMPQFVTKILNGTEMDVGIIFSVPPIFEVPLMIAFGILATKWDNGLLIRIGFLISSVYFLLMLFVSEPWQIYPLQILNAAQVAITAGIAITYFQNFIPEEPGTATTLFMNTTQIGSTVSYLLFGIAAEVLNYNNVFIICFAFSTIGFFILLIYGKVKGSDPHCFNA